jgi:methionine-rich copper-binding protein CopC
MMASMMNVRSIALAGAAFLAAAALSVSSLHAAARFDHASPGPEQVVEATPVRVEIWTVRATSPDPLGTQATVTDLNQQRVDTGETTVDPADHHHFWVGLQPDLPAGRYIVSFKTLGQSDFDYDGGNYAFYVKTPPTAAQLNADRTLSLTTLDDPETLTGYQRGFVEGGLGLVVALPAAYYIWQRRRHGKRDETDPASLLDETR